jgi:cytochrome c oxidase subunit 4
MNTHILSRKTYVFIWFALMALLFLTWGLAQINLGAFNIVVMLSIAIVKTILVILFFMHVKYSPRLVWVFVAAGFIWLAIMIDLTLSDYLTRGRIRGVGQSWKHTETKPSAPGARN